MYQESKTGLIFLDLAKSLIARHIRISAPNSKMRDWLAEQEIVDYPTNLVESRMRCILVVGAGASEPLLARSGDLALRLEGEFGRDAAELNRLHLVNNLNPKAFETRLIALSKNPDAAQKVKAIIGREYNIRYPTLLTYELIAHLLKHRFIDAIVSFNFDELLDRSLDDELSETEYRTIVSERDCSDVQPDADAADYIPLYVKLHGTASETESLRFTPDSYYTLPTAMVDIVKDLLHVDRCVIVNVGSGLASFDFQQLLGIPRSLDIYDLSYTALDSQVRIKIDDERRGVKGDTDGDGQERTFDWLHTCANNRDRCDEHLQSLCAAIQAETTKVSSAIGPITQFRSTHRHQVIARLLGPASRFGDSSDTPRWSSQSEVDYLKRRTILELAFAGAKSRGLLSLVPLSRDRPARYFELYQQRTNWHGSSWTSLCSAAGLAESESIPDVLESACRLRDASPAKIEVGAEDPTHKLHEFDPDALAEHVLRRVKNPAKPDDKIMLSRTIKELQSNADVELHTQDDRVCSKAFKQPRTLRTATALKLYTWLMLSRLEPDDRVYISTETGGWLCDDPIYDLLARQRKLKVLLAFDIEALDLKRKYSGVNLKMRCANPWHHNRHMTIICTGKRPVKAIYFARHLRTPVITAVYLESIRDVAHLMKTYRVRWKEATPVVPVDADELG